MYLLDNIGHMCMHAKVCIPKTNIESKTNIIYHNLTFSGFKCMTMIDGVDLGHVYLNITYLTLK
jgi:hypothetical protein